MKCIVVDDNALARMIITELAANVKNLEIVKEFDNAPEAYEFMKNNKIDLIFLDVEMPGMSGLELVRSLSARPVTIFTTSQKKYASEAYDLSVADYLVKPITLPRLLQAVSKAELLLGNTAPDLENGHSEILFIKENKVIKKIRLEDVLWFEAMGDYVKIILPERFHVVHTSLRQLEEKLDQTAFLKVHRSYIVSLDKIECIEDGIIMINKNPIPLAETFRLNLFKKINIA